MDVDSTRLHGPNFVYRHGGMISHEEAGVGSSPIVSRRSVSARGEAGAIGQRLREGQRGEDPLLPPLFEVHFEMNPTDPDYDSKIYLAIDQASEGQRAGGSMQGWHGRCRNGRLSFTVVCWTVNYTRYIPYALCGAPQCPTTELRCLIAPSYVRRKTLAF